MNPERWKRIDAVLQAALDLSASDRAPFLDAECGDDVDLRREVESLLSADRRASSFIETPAVEAAPGLVVESARELPDGILVAGYRLLSLIGVGGMGEVYRAESVRDGRVVALKLLPDALAGDAKLRARFLREARLASALDHPNVCAIHDVGRADGTLYIAMRYVEGETLKRLVAARPLPLDRTLSIAVQTADAIAAAHKQGIVHRDLKSSNVIVTETGHAVVLDFGLAKLLDDVARSTASALTRPGTVLGTPAYMSPEQARGEPADHRSDLFSLGVVIYEMATGRLPFERATEAETLTAVVDEPHAPLTSLDTSVPRDVAAIVDRALAKVPADRFPSMREMRDALARHIASASSIA